MKNTETYNPFERIWVFTQMYCKIIVDELTNDNAKAFYAGGWAAHDEAIAWLEEFTFQGWKAHADYCASFFGPFVLMAIAAFRIWQNRNAGFLPAPYMPKEPVALIAPSIEAAIDFSWVDWKAYLEFLFKARRAT